MAGKINVFNLGERGVQIVKSPIHTEDGDMTNAQNAISNPNQREGGLTKRGSLQRLNSSALAGSVEALVNVPLALDVTRTLYAAIDAASGDTWRTSTDGSTWAGATSPARAQRLTRITTAGLDAIFGGHNRIAGFNRRLYYPADNTQPPTLRAWDGTNDVEVVSVPANAAVGAQAALIGDMAVLDGRLYFCTNDEDGGAGTHGRVFEYNPLLSSISQVGQAFQDGVSSVKGFPWVLTAFLGRLWMGTSGGFGGANADGQIYSIIPGVQTSWVLEKEFTEGWVQSMGVFRDELFVSVNNAVASGSETPKIYVRDNTDGTFGAVLTGATSTGTSWYSTIVVYDGYLFATHFVNDASPSFEILRSETGASWSQVYDIEANHSGQNRSGQAVVLNDELFLVVGNNAAANGRILRLTGGFNGTWSAVDSAVSHRGFLSILTEEG